MNALLGCAQLLGVQHAESLPAPAVQSKVHEILARPEYRRGFQDNGWLRRLVEKIDHFLSELFGMPVGAGGEVLFWLVKLLIVALVVWLVVRVVVWFVRRRVRTEEAPAVADPETARRERVADLRRRAVEADRRGERVLALRLYFTALVVGLGERGDLEYRDAWTNRELFERGEPSPAVQQTLAPLVERLDRHSFGGEPAGPDDVSEMARLVDRHLGALAS